MKTILVYPPFGPNATPPYSICNLYSFLKANSKEDISVLDLNAQFHKLKFPQYFKFYQNINFNDYENITNNYMKDSANTYSVNNKDIRFGKMPELFGDLLKNITDQKPDLVAFSIVFSSQVFYAKVLIEELNKLNIKTVVGGPAVNKILADISTPLTNEIELLKQIRPVTETEILDYPSLDFSVFPNDYFNTQLVIPMKTSSSCYYRQCAFCTHHQHTHYYEFPLEKLKQTIITSKAKGVFFVDDMIHKKRLLEIAHILKPLNVSWTCQLKPTKDLDEQTLTILKESGLKIIYWGVESANNRILKLMKKGTNKADIQIVLNNTKKVGIKNALYIIFGFPSETKEELLETIDFLKSNSDVIDIVSTSIFGLQKGTPIYKNPEQFCITKITEHERTVLDSKIEYEVSSGLTNEEASHLRKGHKKTIEHINKYPKAMNYFREHLLMMD